MVIQSGIRESLVALCKAAKVNPSLRYAKWHMRLVEPCKYGDSGANSAQTSTYAEVRSIKTGSTPSHFPRYRLIPLSYRSCRNPIKGATPVPGPSMTSGAPQSAGGVKPSGMRRNSGIGACTLRTASRNRVARVAAGPTGVNVSPPSAAAVSAAGSTSNHSHWPAGGSFPSDACARQRDSSHAVQRPGALPTVESAEKEDNGEGTRQAVRESHTDPRESDIPSPCILQTQYPSLSHIPQVVTAQRTLRARGLPRRCRQC